MKISDQWIYNFLKFQIDYLEDLTKIVRGNLYILQSNANACGLFYKYFST